MYLKIRSRHPSHEPLRNWLRLNRRVVFRLGSSTNVPNAIEINSANACMNSANKRTMKELFQQHNVITALWIFPQDVEQLTNWLNQNDLTNCKLIIKSLRGSRGRGLYLKQSGQEVINFFAEKGYGNYIVEKFYDYNREYRLHVSRDGCFYTCRKMLREDTPADRRWFRNDSNSNWIVEENPLFDKPTNWNIIEQECVKALNAVRLDLGACDVRVQSSTTKRGEVRANPAFIICEINSAPSFGEKTLIEYKKQIEKICADYLASAG